MKPEDKYTAGLAGGLGVGAAGFGAFRAGGSMAASGRAQARENAGSRGMATRGGRLIRAGADMQREAERGLGAFRRIETPKGVRYMDGSKWAKTKGLTDQARQGGESLAQGKELAAGAAGRRSAAREGIKRFQTGRWARKGGLAAVAAGGAVAASSVVAGERHQNKRRGELKRVAPAMPAPSAEEIRARVNGGWHVR